MKKFSFKILLVLLLFSCSENKNTKLNSVIPKKEIIDSSTFVSVKPLKDTTISKDTLVVINEVNENILTEENRKSTYHVKSISDLWKQYKHAKEKASKFTSDNNLDSTIVYLLLASEAAYELSREDIATWQLNNIGYYSINEFKNRTNYEKRMQKLVTFDNLRQKALFSEETKTVFRNNFKILSRAEKYVRKAQLLDSELEPSNRTQIIESNIQFIEWIGEYISNSNIKHRSEDLE